MDPPLGPALQRNHIGWLRCTISFSLLRSAVYMVQVRQMERQQDQYPSYRRCGHQIKSNTTHLLVVDTPSLHEGESRPEEKVLELHRACRTCRTSSEYKRRELRVLYMEYVYTCTSCGMF